MPLWLKNLFGVLLGFLLLGLLPFFLLTFIMSNKYLSSWWENSLLNKHLEDKSYRAIRSYEKNHKQR